MTGVDPSALARGWATLLAAHAGHGREEPRDRGRDARAFYRRARRVQLAIGEPRGTSETCQPSSPFFGWACFSLGAARPFGSIYTSAYTKKRARAPRYRDIGAPRIERLRGPGIFEGPLDSGPGGAFGKGFRWHSWGLLRQAFSFAKPLFMARRPRRRLTGTSV
jgi:hypothetical protein